MDFSTPVVVQLDSLCWYLSNLTRFNENAADMTFVSNFQIFDTIR